MTDQNQNSGQTSNQQTTDKSTDENPPAWFTRWENAQRTAQQQQQQQQQPPQQSQQTQGGGQQAGYGPQILQTLQALPEAIGNVVKEAFPTQQQSQQSSSDQGEKQSTGERKETTSENPGPSGTNLTRQQRFVRWWGTP